jgi:hypothetical protein
MAFLGYGRVTKNAGFLSQSRVVLTNTLFSNHGLLPSLKDVDHIANFPKPISHASRHCRCHFERIMDADEIVIEEVKRHRVRVVSHLLRKGVRQARHAARMHPHVEIVALRIGRRNVLLVGFARNGRLDRASAFGRAVAALGALRSRAVELYKHGVIDSATERGIDRIEICLVTVRCDLNARGEARREIIDKLIGRPAITSADMPARDKFLVVVCGKPKPCVARVNRLALHRGDVLLLGPDETPNLIDLEALALEALKNAVLIPGRRLARVHNELADSRLAGAGQSGDCANAHPLAKEVNDFCTVLSGQPVHTDRYT